MQVFKNYFKILKKRSRTIIIYFVIFTILILMIGAYSSDDSNDIFEQSKAEAVFINNDGDTALTENLYSYLENTCNFTDGYTYNDIDYLKDSVFYEELDYVIIIPEGFTEDFINGEDVSIEKIYSVSDSDSDYVDLAINNYLSTASTFFTNFPDMSEDEIISLIDDSLDTSVTTTITSAEDSTLGTYEFMATFLNYFVYILTAVFIIIITVIMTSYSQIDLRRRNLVSPLTFTQMQRQLISANIIFAIASTMLLFIIGMLISGTFFIDKIILLLIINALCFGFCAMGISFLISQFGLKHQINILLSNVISLSFAFLCGAFVPQSLLTDSILNVSRFLPAYWFISTNDLIADAGSFTSELFDQCLKNIGVLILFTAALFALSAVVAKFNQQKEN